MLKFNKVSENVVEMEQIINGYQDFEVSYVYCDLKNMVKSGVLKEKTDNPEFKYPITKECLNFINKQHFEEILVC